MARADDLVLCHGGPIATPEDARYVLDHCRGVEGFYGARSMKRLPTQAVIADQARRFSKMKHPSNRP